MSQISQSSGSSAPTHLYIVLHQGNYNISRGSINGEERSMNCCACYEGCQGGRMSAGGENAGLAVGQPQTTQRVSLIDGALLLLGLEAHTHLFHTGLNLAVLFHLCPVQVTRI